MPELMAAAIIYTIQKHRPDRIAGFSPIPAISMISYAGDARMMQLMGGVSLSFYDWYRDLPPRHPRPGANRPTFTNPPIRTGFFSAC